MTETIQKEDKETEEIKEAKKAGYWDDLSQKGKRDAEIKEQLAEIRTKAKTELFNTEVTRERFESNFIPNIESQVKNILDPYDLPEEETTRRVNEMIEEQEELFEYAQMNAYGEIAFNSYQAYKIFDGLKSSIYEGEFKLRSDKIEIRFIDPSRIQLTKITFNATTFRFFQEGKVAVNMDDLAKALKATKSEKSITTIIFTETELKITKCSTELDIPIKDTLSAIDIEIEELPMETLLSLKFPFTFKLTKEQFNYILKHTDIHSEVISITATPEQLLFGQSGQIGERTIPLEKSKIAELSLNPKLLLNHEDDKQTDLPHEARCGYSLAYLRLVSKMLYLLDKSDTITFHMKTDHPLLVEIRIPLRHIKQGEIGKLLIRNFIGPRMIDASDEIEEVEDEF
ncbi:MAG: hypothetical protein EU548_08745 [Promethearchaeota archaeon]|nr:MAG: hypothetical protein EU548_08745 [Candidatus Lokiarchaeota archaeon]